MQRFLDSAEQAGNGAQRDLAAMIAERNGYIQSWHADIAEKLAEAAAKLSDARESFNKAQLRRQLVELRADQDATVLTVGKVLSGVGPDRRQQFITLVPANAPLEIEANIPGSEDGYVHVGDPVAVKFDTFPYTQYGMAHGVVRIVSPDSFNAQDDQRNPSGAVPIPGSGSVRQGPARMWYRARITPRPDRPARYAGGFPSRPGMPVTADVWSGSER
jgi:hemolysin D